MNELSVMTDSNIMLFDESRFAQLEKIANVMAQGSVSIPRHLQQKPGDCLAVAMQAAQWGMNPFAVAQKTYFINHTISYEAQLVNAVVSTSKAIQGAFKYEYIGNWEAITGTKPTSNTGWGDKEKGLAIKVGAILAGDAEITWGEPVYLSAVQVRNSPLWKTHIKQQIAYLAVNMWARMYTPAVILGVYTPEEVVMRDIAPETATEESNREKLNQHKQAVKKSKSSTKKGQTIDGDAKVVPDEPELSIDEFIEKINVATDPAEIKALIDGATHFKGANRAKASKAYKARIVKLKDMREPGQKPADDAPRPIYEAYRLLKVAKTSDDISVAVDYVMGLNKEGKTTMEEIEAFDKEQQKVFDQISASVEETEGDK